MRAPFLLAAIGVSLACRDKTPTRPDYTPTYSLHAYAPIAYGATTTDSIACELHATWPSAEAIVAPWSGTVIVSARRVKRGGRLLSSPLHTGSATLTIINGPGDSVRVTLSGAVNIVLDGRMPTPNLDATGQWTCGAESSFGSPALGEAHGTWYLSRDYLID